MKRLLIPTLLALPMTLVACGGGGPTDPFDAGAVALQDGDYAEAEASYTEAQTSAELGSDDWKAATVGLFQARAHLAPDTAAADFLALAADDATGLGEKEYSKVLAELYQAKAYLKALDIAHAGKVRWPESAKMDSYITKLIEKAEGDSALSAALAGHGYVGGDD